MLVVLPIGADVSGRVVPSEGYLPEMVAAVQAGWDVDVGKLWSLHTEMGSEILRGNGPAGSVASLVAPDGTFRIPGLVRGGGYQLVALGQPMARSLPVTVTAGAPGTPTLRMERTGAIAVRLGDGDETSLRGSLVYIDGVLASRAEVTPEEVVVWRLSAGRHELLLDLGGPTGESDFVVDAGTTTRLVVDVPRHSIQGVVRTETGAPISDAVVRATNLVHGYTATHRSGRYLPSSSGVAWSGADGVFRIDRLGACLHDVFVTRSGFDGCAVFGVQPSAGSVDVKLRVAGPPPMVTISPAVESGVWMRCFPVPSTGPVGPLSIDIALSMGPGKISGTGSVPVEELSRGRNAVRVTAPGFRPLETFIDVTGREAGPIPLVLSRQVSVSGSLTWPDGRACGGAEVEILGGGAGNGSRWRFCGRTADDGSFRAAWVPWQDGWVRFRAGHGWSRIVRWAGNSEGVVAAVRSSGVLDIDVGAVPGAIPAGRFFVREPGSGAVWEEHVDVRGRILLIGEPVAHEFWRDGLPSITVIPVAGTTQSIEYR